MSDRSERARRTDQRRLAASQSFNPLEVELLSEIMTILLRGGDLRRFSTRRESRDLARKIATMKVRIEAQRARRAMPKEREPMRGLTLKQPWAHAVTRQNDPKDIENRTTLRPSPELLGDPRPFFAIHAGSAYDGAPLASHRGFSLRREQNAFPPGPVPLESECEMGAIIAVARVRAALDLRKPKAPVVLGVDRSDMNEWEHVLSMPKLRWWIGPIGWMLMDVFPLVRPVPCRGMLGLWPLDEGTESMVRAVMPEDAQRIAREIEDECASR